MSKKFNKVADAVFETTALALAKNDNVTASIVQNEMQLGHQRQLATLAIDTLIDERREEYDTQRRQLAQKRSKAVELRNELNSQLGETVKDFIDKEVRPRAANLHASVAAAVGKIKGLQGSVDTEKEFDASKGVSTELVKGDQGITAIKYKCEVKMKGCHNLPVGDEITNLPKAVRELEKAVKTEQDRIDSIDKAAAEIVTAVQEVERDRTALKRQLDKQTLEGSVYGKDMLAAVRSLYKTPLKQLPAGL